MRKILIAACLTVITGLAGCESLDVFNDNPDAPQPGTGQPAPDRPVPAPAPTAVAPAPAAAPAPVPITGSANTQASSGGSWFWPFGGGGGNDGAVAADGGPQLGVNGFLWRASLDTLNFIPLTSADPVGGVIISDWYSDPKKPDEHVKVTVYILDKRLRADALKVSVFRQTRAPAGWVDAQINPDTQIKLENAILSRARELRLAATPQ